MEHDKECVQMNEFTMRTILITSHQITWLHNWLYTIGQHEKPEKEKRTRAHTKAYIQIYEPFFLHCLYSNVLMFNITIVFLCMQAAIPEVCILPLILHITYMDCDVAYISCKCKLMCVLAWICVKKNLWIFMS